jgi:ADP-dependent NAD(P)H-hydrate dehydratase / NAD(P)H-hydrate epimerase
VKILTAAEMREVDRLTTEKYGVPSLTLMENAGKSVADFIVSRFRNNMAKWRIIVLCGKGNNGGDGFAAARYLRQNGASVSVYLFANPAEVKGDAAENLNKWQQTEKIVVGSPIQQPGWSGFQQNEIVVDALLGTGVRGAVEGPLAELIDAVNRRPVGRFVVAVDIPSGLNADTGEVPGPVVHADYTVTFTAPKLGLVLHEGQQHTGALVVREIGSPSSLIEEVGKSNLRWSEADEFRTYALPREASGHKGDYGHALIVAGSVGKSGAAVMAGTAALRAGAGLVTVATPEPVLPVVAAHTPEIMTEPLAATRAGTVSESCLQGNLFGKLLEGKRALAVGPGLTTQEETRSFVQRVVRSRETIPIILDADGLNAFVGRGSELRDPKGLLAITPHPGEMARLLSSSTKEVQAKRVEIALKAARDWNACVVLKGYQTVTAAPDGRAWINSTGNPGMGTGGTGDVLTGVLTGLTAQYGTDSWPGMLAFGVYLHGLSGDIPYAENGGAPLMATDLIRCLPRAFHQFYVECGRG